MLTIKQLKQKARWAERKAEENANSDKPWAMRNLRYYQNCAYKWWGDYFAAIGPREKDA